MLIFFNFYLSLDFLETEESVNGPDEGRASLTKDMDKTKKMVILSHIVIHLFTTVIRKL